MGSDFPPAQELKRGETDHHVPVFESRPTFACGGENVYCQFTDFLGQQR
jgi:hypothetical protein